MPNIHIKDFKDLSRENLFSQSLLPFVSMDIWSVLNIDISKRIFFTSNLAYNAYSSF